MISYNLVLFNSFKKLIYRFFSCFDLERIYLFILNSNDIFEWQKRHIKGMRSSCGCHMTSHNMNMSIVLLVTIIIIFIIIIISTITWYMPWLPIILLLLKTMKKRRRKKLREIGEIVFEFIGLINFWWWIIFRLCLSALEDN